jgi:peptidoglycan/xylan/chitin deacetylase (PgdA/CDA1 family)
LGEVSLVSWSFGRPGPRDEPREEVCLRVSAGLAVIVYHAIGDCPRHLDHHNLFVSPDAFSAQLDYLSRHREVVSLEAMLQGRLARTGRPTVAITFDDGYRSVLTTAGPMLARYGFTATIFVPTGWIGQPNSWVQPRGCPCEVMTSDELVLAQEFGFEIGSHGDAHIDLGALSRSQIEEDVQTSVVRLTEILGNPPRYFAYPYGRSSSDARGVLKDAGFRAAFGIDHPSDGPFAQERVPILPYDGHARFAFKTSGRYVAWRRSRLVSTTYSVLMRSRLGSAACRRVLRAG